MKKHLNTAYHCGKIVEGVHDYQDDTYRQLGLVNLRLVEGRLAEMLKDLQQSPEWKDTPDLQTRLRFYFEPLKHAITFLESFLQSKSHSTDEELTAIIFAGFIDDRAPKLIRDFGCEDPGPGRC
jgi:hypothetical protein